MKKFIYILFTLLITQTGFSQTLFNKEDLPQYLIQNGDTVGIVLTIEQVQKLDNNSELLISFKKLSFECDSLETYYVQVINKQSEKIALLEVKISNLTEQNKTKDDMIVKLKEMIMIKESQLIICEKQRSNDSIIIKGLKKDLLKSKIKNIVGWTTTGIGIGVAVFLGLFLGLR